jgi:hypothetical protein
VNVGREEVGLVLVGNVDHAGWWAVSKKIVCKL